MPLREQAKIVNQLTFSTERKYMATLVDSPIQGKRVLYIKGAPEIVMSKCQLSSQEVTSFNEQLLAYQNKAMRTLGLAYKYIPEGASEDCSELVNEGGLTFPAFLPSATRSGRMFRMLSRNASLPASA